VAEEEGAGVGHLGDAATRLLEAADLIGGTEPVLEGADEAQRGLPVALEVADDVDQVLQHARPRDLPVLRDMADDDDRKITLLRHADERRRDLAHLAGMPRRSVDEAGADRLDRVDDQQLGTSVVDMAQDRGEVGFARRGRARRGGRWCARRAGAPVRATPRRSRTARRPARAVCAATSSSNVDFPTPGSPDSRMAAPGTRPPPSTRSNSPTPVVRRGVAVSIEVMGRSHA
jgi:hypothetical protein